ncbi:hypothetical protein [Sphingomonas sp. NPDC079357]|uniref:hypothetical protein n=1 Tax=Sphingomonas sp. NPDC079357 TaxID=3364518 RepID=UPI00384DB295
MSKQSRSSGPTGDQAAEKPGVDPERVRVRMYRAWKAQAADHPGEEGMLGDCFLLRLESGTSASHILIDCGMLLGSGDAKARMQTIAQDIARVCGGTLDLVVISHEHWDHLSGFSQARDVFFDSGAITIKNVWMGWTENPDDAQAQRLRTRFDRSGVALAKIGARLRNEARFGADVARRELFGLDQFTGLAADATGDRPPRLSGRGVLDELKKYHPTYLEPGSCRHTPGAVSLRAHVLGPPRAEDKLFKDQPSRAAPETYLDEPSIDGLQLLRFGEGEDPDPSRDSPFAPDYCRFTLAGFDKMLAATTPPDDAVCAFVREHYYGTFGAGAIEQAAIDRRRIDTDWLSSAGAMALKLNNDTNNTSLVLAFELPDQQRSVLLFPGDAQVGNWESWHSRDYDAGDGVKIKAADLLARTLLYKVSHHGSHNATLREQGLEMMTHPGLFAMIPTDEVLGKQQGSGWMMPNPRVNKALRKQTGGRILRNDRRYDGDRSVDPETRDVPADFLAKLTETDLFLEYPVYEGRSA